MGIIGLDVGGTNVRYSFTDELDSKDMIYHKRPFIKMNNPKTEVEMNICNIIDAAPGDVKGIGISLAAIMDREDGIVKTWPNNPCWNHYELVKHLDERYNVPIIIEDDANCGAIAEYDHLNTVVKNMAYITIGTGIGCGLILNSSLFTGDNGFAGELGHVWVNTDNEVLCSCGNRGCFQSIASGSAILNQHHLASGTSLESLEQVYEQYIQNDPIAVRCLSNMISNISRVVYNIVMCLDISFFVIGGGVSDLGAEFIANIESKVNDRLELFEREISIVQAQLKEFSGVYGAMQLIKKHIVIGKGKSP